MYSHYINILTKFLWIRYRVLVLTNSFLPDDISGRCNYRCKYILLNELEACKAFETLLHETGHWLFYTHFYWFPQSLISVRVREYVADKIAYKLRQK